MLFRKKIVRIFVFTSLGILAFVVLLLTSIELFSTPYLERNRHNLERWVEKIIDQPVIIDKVDIEQHWLMPVFSFSNVKLLSTISHETLAEVKDLNIKIDIVKSLLHRSLQPSSLEISGANLHFYQDKNGVVSLKPQNNAITPESGSKIGATFNDVLGWIFQQKNIVLQDIAVVWSGNTGKNFSFHFPHLELYAEPTTKSKAHPTSLNFILELPQNALTNQQEQGSELVNWLSEAFSEENSITGTVNLEGFWHKNELDKKFLLTLHLKGVHFHYYHDWPPLKDIDADVFYDGQSFRVAIHSGNLIDIHLQDIDASINDIANPVLQVTSKVNTTMNAALQLLEATPLKDSLATKLNGLALDGPLNLALNLSIPLGNTTALTNIAGTINLDNNTLTVSGWDLVINTLNGSLSFTSQGITTSALTGELFGNKINLNLATVNPDNNQYSFTAVNIVGAIDGKTLNDALNLPFAKFIEGITNYTAQLELRDLADKNSSTLLFKSDLAGIKLVFPPPFAKASEIKVPLQLALKFKDIKPQQLAVAYSNAAHANLVFIYEAPKLAKVSLQHGEELFSDVPDMSIKANISKINIDDWRDFFASNFEEKTTFSPLITDANLNIAELKIAGQTLRPAIIHISLPRESDFWLIKFNSHDIQGSFTLPYDEIYSVLEGHFTRLHLQTPTSGKKLININPKNILPLAISGNNFRFDNQNYNYFKLKTSPINNGININQLNINAPLFDLATAGKWQKFSNHDQVQLYGTMAITNLGKFFNHLNFGNKIIDGSGKFSFNLNWRNSLFPPDINTISGELSSEFTKGKLVNLNFTSFPGQGFIVDKFSSNSTLKAGNVFVQNAEILGPLARILLQGRVGLKNQDYNLKINILASTNLSAGLPVLATIAGGPIAGLIAWVAHGLLQISEKNVISLYYLITGSWSKPIITKTNK